MSRAEMALAAVDSLLERQRRALLAGDLAGLMQVPDRLAAALRDLDRFPPAAPALARLQTAADHNARLLLAAQRGVAQACGRLEGDRTATLTTYGADGRKAAAPQGPRVLSRR